MQFLPDGGWGPPIPPRVAPQAATDRSSGRARGRLEFQTFEAESVRFVGWADSEDGRGRVIVEDTRRDGRLRELARDQVRHSETREERKQRRADASTIAWEEFFGELGNPDPWWVVSKHSELPEALQRRDQGMRGRALTTIT